MAKRTRQPQYAARLRSEYRDNLLGFFPNSNLALPTHNLTFAGNAAYGTTDFGKAILYDGTGDYTSAGDAFYSDEYTILVTVNANVLDANPKSVIIKRNLGTAASTNEYWLEVTSTQITFHAWNGGTEILNFGAAISPVAGKTYTVGIDIPPGSGTAYMYVNGVLGGSGSKSNTITNGGADLQFGALAGGTAARYWNGYIGQAAFWSKRRQDTRELTANPWQILTPRKRQLYVSASSTPTGTLSQTLGGLSASATGTVKIAGTTSGTLSAATSSATGTLAIVGSASPTLGAVTSAATGTVAIVGTLSKTLDAATLAATGELSAPGTGVVNKVLADATASATGTVAIVGSASVNLGALGLSSASAIRINASLAQTLASATLSATGAAVGAISGTASVTLGSLTLSAAGQGLWADVARASTVWTDAAGASGIWTEI